MQVYLSFAVSIGKYKICHFVWYLISYDLTKKKCTTSSINVKFTLEQAMKAQMNRGIALLFL